ncbi:hypothetical protein L6452_14605 [Arctium lappa]|uniref:Uncharacterized protein n=1 Tax=Arctium lappa TaxID=4217 RepID=A0ACB9CLY8_ARCLA|nr:hypothetical protein L6452_14605 [Arctium lappa]
MDKDKTSVTLISSIKSNVHSFSSHSEFKFQTHFQVFSPQSLSPPHLRSTHNPVKFKFWADCYHQSRLFFHRFVVCS